MVPRTLARTLCRTAGGPCGPGALHVGRDHITTVGSIGSGHGTVRPTRRARGRWIDHDEVVARQRERMEACARMTATSAPKFAVNVNAFGLLHLLLVTRGPGAIGH